ncbi:hypothetical protein [Thermus filiformis]|nr:hypothetical protein [Thermus filiformis]
MPEPFLVQYVRRQKALGKEISEPLLRLLEGGILGAGIPEGESSPEEARVASGEALLANLPPPFLSRRLVEPAPPSWSHDDLRAEALRLASLALERGEREGTLPGLTEGERKVYRLLLALGILALLRRGKVPPKALAQVTAFAPNEALAAAVGVSTATLYRILAGLEAKGLVARRAWRVPATVHGKTGVYTAGTVYAVRMPHRERRPRVGVEDLRHRWRDLDEDISAGRTAWRAVRESIDSPPKGDLEALEFVLRFSLPPGELKTALLIDSLTAVNLRGPARRARVWEVALGLAKEFRDPGSVAFYAKLLWGALRLTWYGLREDALKVLEWAIARVREAMAAGGRRIHRPGALLASLLKQQGLLQAIQEAPAWRVA